MSAPNSLSELYVEELKDLWSANDQMAKAVKQLTDVAHDQKLKQLLERSVDGIQQHTAVLRGLIESAGGDTPPDHCKGMEGLVTEAKKHAVTEAPADGALRDIEIVAQYQRMSHYGIAGFGSASAYAKALGKTGDETGLKKATAEIYKSDEFATHLSESLQRAAA